LIFQWLCLHTAGLVKRQTAGISLLTTSAGQQLCPRISSNTAEWLGSRVVSVRDSRAEWPGFKSHPRRCRVTVLGKLFTPIVPLFNVYQAAKLVAALLRVAGVTAGLAAYCRVYDSPHLQADCQEPGSAPELYARVIEYGLPLPFIVDTGLRNPA